MNSAFNAAGDVIELDADGLADEIAEVESEGEEEMGLRGRLEARGGRGRG